MFEVGGVDRVNSTKNHRLNHLETCQRFGCRGKCSRQSIADLDLGRRLDVRDHIASFSASEHRDRLHLRTKDAHFLHFVGAVVAHHFHPIACLDRSTHHPHISHHPSVGVEGRIKDQGPHFFVGPRFRGRNPGNHRFENLFNANPRLRTCQNRLFPRDRQNFLELLFHGGDIRVRQIDFVDYWHDG